MSDQATTQQKIEQALKDQNLVFIRANSPEWESPPYILFEIWCKERKLSIYFESKEITLLRVWGVHIDDEMSEHVLNKSEDIQQHIAWLKSEQ
jgi:murein L,D-transpeptidase YcbB/YkuD